jgi:hypothetical protein
MAKITLDLNRFKASGVYTVEFDASESVVISTQTIRLVVGFSRKGPFNAPVFLRDVKNARRIFGEIDKFLETKGSFFHRALEICLATGPVFALNLLPLNNVPVAEGGDATQYRSFALAANEGNGNVTKALLASFFNQERFWFPDAEYLQYTVNANFANSGRLFNIVNVGQTPSSVIVRKSVNASQYNVTAEDYYGSGNVPEFVQPKDFLSDYFIDVIVVEGDWTKLSQLSIDPLYSAYFDERGIKLNKLNEFLGADFITLIGSFSGCIIPNFIDNNGSNQSIQTIVNNAVGLTGVFLNVNATQLSDYANSTYKVDLVGHSLIAGTDDTIDFLSYNTPISAELLYNDGSSFTVNQYAVGSTSPYIKSVPYGNNRTGNWLNTLVVEKPTPSDIVFTPSMYEYIKRSLTNISLVRTAGINSALVVGNNGDDYVKVENVIDTGTSLEIQVSSPLWYPGQALPTTIDSTFASIIPTGPATISVTAFPTLTPVLGDFILIEAPGVKKYYEVVSIALGIITVATPTVGSGSPYFQDKWCSDTVADGIALNFGTFIQPTDIKVSLYQIGGSTDDLIPDLTVLGAGFEFVFAPDVVQTRPNSTYAPTPVSSVPSLTTVDIPAGYTAADLLGTIVYVDPTSLTGDITSGTRVIGFTPGASSGGVVSFNTGSLVQPTTILPGPHTAIATTVLPVGGTGLTVNIATIDGIVISLPGYTPGPGPYTPSTLFGNQTAFNVLGTGSGLQCAVTTNALGGIASITITPGSNGSGYAVGDTFYLPAASMGGTAPADDIIFAALVPGNLTNDIAGVTVNTPGTGYAIGNTITMTVGSNDGTINVLTLTPATTSTLTLSKPLPTLTSLIAGDIINFREYQIEAYPASKLARNIKSALIVNGDKANYAGGSSTFNYLGVTKNYSKSGLSGTNDVFSTIGYGLIGSALQEFDDSSLVTLSTTNWVGVDETWETGGIVYNPAATADVALYSSTAGNLSENVTIMGSLFGGGKKFKTNAANGAKIEVGQFLVNNDINNPLLTRVIAKIKKINPSTGAIEYEFEVLETPAVNALNQVTRYQSIQSFCDRLQFTYLEGFKLTSYHLPNKTESQVDRIYGVLERTNLADVLKSRDVISFRYIIDTFNNGLAPQMGSKQYLSRLAKNRQKCMALLNAPSIAEFQASTDPRFTELPNASIGNPMPVLNTEYISTGGNLTLGPSFKFTLPDEDQGAKFIGVFSPNIVIRENGQNMSIPPAADVSNNFIRKFINGTPYGIVAGPRRGVISNPKFVGLEYDFLLKDREFIEPIGINPIVIVRNVGPMIYGNQSAYQRTLSAFNNLHVRDLLITVEEAVEDVLGQYLFEFNDAATRLEIRTIVENYLDTVRNAGGVYDFAVIMDESNNTPGIIDQNFGILDIGIEPARGLQKFVNRVTILKTGAIASGGFSVA